VGRKERYNTRECKMLGRENKLRTQIFNGWWGEAKICSKVSKRICAGGKGGVGKTKEHIQDKFLRH